VCARARHRSIKLARVSSLQNKSELVVDVSYEKVLQGLQVAAPQAGVVVLENLLAWRRETLTAVGQAFAVTADSSIILRKRVRSIVTLLMVFPTIVSIPTTTIESLYMCTSTQHPTIIPYPVLLPFFA